MSKIIEITEHSNCCNIESHFERWSQNYCKMNPELFVFVLNGDFFVILIPKCQILGEKYEYFVDLIKQIKKIRVFEDVYFINKSIKDDDFRNLRLRGIELNTRYFECCYSYDGYGKNYKIVSELKLSYNQVSNYNENLTKNYNEILELIKPQRNVLFLTEKINELYNINKINDWSSDVEQIKTVDELIKKLKL
jgi:L-rhamnose mutarotase